MKVVKFVVLCCLFFSSAGQAETKRIGILVFDGVLTSDVTAPLEVFGVASRKSWFSSYEPVTISVNRTDSVTTEEGLKLVPDTWIGDSPQLDVLIVPSSYDMKPLRSNKRLIAFIRDTGRSAEWMASNCSGAFLLADAGLLAGLKATTWAGGETDLAKEFPEIDVQFDENVVVDRRIITSNGSLVSYQAALVLLEKLASVRKADEVANALQYPRFSQKPYVL